MLHHKESGTGQPLILIHGLFGNLDNLAACGRHMEAQGLRVIRVDLANHGQSPTQMNVSYHTMAQDVIQLLDELNIETCHLLGHSMGGKVAMAVALADPSRVESLIVADIAPLPYESHHSQVFKGLDALWQQGAHSRAEADQVLSVHITEAGVRQFLLKNVVWQSGKIQWRLRYPEVKQSYGNILDWPYSEQSYDGPTLFIKGALSDYIDHASREPIQRQFPNARAHIIQNAGHWLHAEKTDTFNGIVSRFLSA